MHQMAPLFKKNSGEAPHTPPPLSRRGHPSRTLHLDGFAVLAKRLSAAWQCLLNCFSLLLAHLSRRLIGELIGYSWSGVRPSSVRRRSECSKIFSKTTGEIKAKFYVMPPWVGGTIFYSRHLGHMTKIAATPIYDKNPSKIFFSKTGGSIFTKLGM